MPRRVMHAVTYEQGLHLRGTPLWFDAEMRRELCIITGLGCALPPPHQRLITSTDMGEALRRAGYTESVLPSPWDRWVGLGGHRVQLIDAGAAPGCAAALVMSDEAPLLVTGTLRAHRAAWPHASHVVAHLPALCHAGAPLETVAKHVAAAVVAGRGLFGVSAGASAVRPTVWVDTCEVGLAVHKAVLTAGVALTPLGLLGKLLPAGPGVGAGCIAVARSRQRVAAHDVRVSSGLPLWGTVTAPRAATPIIKLKWYADLAALQHVLTVSRARRVSLIGVPPALEAAVTTALGPLVTVRFLANALEMRPAGVVIAMGS